MGRPPVISTAGLTKHYGTVHALTDLTVDVGDGVTGLVGANGAGKSTLLKIMAGLDQPSNGDAFLSPGYSVGILEQEPQLDETKDVIGNVQQGMGAIKAKVDRFNEIAEQMATDYSDELMTEMGKLQEEIDHADAWDLDSQLEQAMDALRCPPPDADVTVLSGGERRRVALCKLLLQQPDLLLLDEPTNHLDAESVQWLEGHLASYPGAVLAVTHDRYFLDNVASWILEIDRGRVTDETAPMTPVDPEHAVLREPNHLAAADFEGWVQELGLYFAATWDEGYTPLLEMADPGEEPKRGSLLVAPLGEGFYVYTGLSFFRQLPAGVPGAYRLLANLLALGAERPAT